jgi:hypothetical protein
MSIPAPATPVVTTPIVIHQQAVEEIRQHLAQATSQAASHQVMPVTAETPLKLQGVEQIDQELDENPIQEYYERAILGKPGHEPSKTFLNKLLERVKKKHPQAEVKLK